MPWMIYALGGGWGHVQRSVSLAREVARRGHEVWIVSNSPAADVVVAETPNLPGECGGIGWRILRPDLPFEATRAEALRHLAEVQPEVLIVDTFPRGLGGELVGVLPELAATRVWVHRAIRPDYVAEKDLAGFARNFQLILIPGEDAELQHLAQSVRTPPWLFLDANELLLRSDSRALLQVESELPVVMVSAAGRVDEHADDAALAQRLALELAGRAEVRLTCCLPFAFDVAPAKLVSIWPLLKILRGVDLVVGAGAYNTVHECRAAGVPLLARPRPRKYDQQSLRLAPNELAPSEDQLAAEILRRLAIAEARSAPSYINGVHAAVDAIERFTEPRAA